MWQRRRVHKSDEGFTLIELLVVLIILAVLAGIVVFAVDTSSSNSKFASCSTDAKAFSNALEEYKALVGVFPGDVSLQIPQGPLNPNPQPLPNFGQTWGINSNAGKTLAGVGGLLGYQGGNWTAPNGVLVGPFLRQLPSTQHYQIVTDGKGEVFVYPAASPDVVVNSSAAAMDAHITVSDVLPNAVLPNPNGDGTYVPDNNFLNYEYDPGICSDPNVVS
jgi:prepilin-type N-terminal cleavage/methylation domain-containing protein